MKNIKDLTCKEAEKELNKIRNKYENFIEDCTQDDFTYAELLVRYINSYSYKENRAVAYSKFTDYKNNIEKAIKEGGDGEVGVTTSGHKEHTLIRLELNLPNKNKKKK